MKFLKSFKLSSITFYFYRIPRERFLEIRDELASILTTPSKSPEEIKSLLYYPYRKATKTSKATNAGGCLYEKYINSRRILIKLGVITKQEILENGKF